MSVSSAENLLDKAIELHKKGELGGAIRAYEKFLTKAPEHAGATNLLGLAYFQNDNPARAVPILERALTLRADLPGASYNLGTVLHVLGRHEEAIGQLEKAIALNPRDAEAHNNLAMSLKAVRRYATAATHFERAIALQPDYLTAYLNLGKLFLDEGQFAKAGSVYKTILARDPRVLHAGFGLAAALSGIGRHDEAISVCQELAISAPASAEAHYNLGKALESAKRFEKAIGSYQAAVRCEPNYGEAHVYLGHCYSFIGRYEDAYREFMLAVSLKLPAELAAKTRLAAGGSLEVLARYDEADRQFDQLIADYPDDALGAEAKKAKAFMYLNLGKLDEGWPLYRYRNVVEGENIREHVKPPWTGEPIRGSLWVWGEHGLGDQILHASMISDLQERVPSLILEVERRLVDLFARSFPNVRVVTTGSDLSAERIEAQIAITKLGQFLRPRWDSFPKRNDGYLAANPERVAALRGRLVTGREKLVGLSWRSVSPVMGHNKSARLIDFASILRTQGAIFVDLQYGDTSEERAAIEREIGITVRRLDDIDNTNDIDGLAALTSACDAVITVSNTTAHLSGALGRPTWVFVPFGFANIWYWFKGKKRSPWYPNAHVRHKEVNQPWDKLLSSASAEISDFLKIE
jgi:tetratricopeptide (TPR) repeat protein